MKTTQLKLMLFLLAGFMFTACTDSFTGPEGLGLEELASANTEGRMADLSLLLEVNRDASIFEETPAGDVEVYVKNEGPSDATGVQLAFTFKSSCEIERGGDDDDEPGGDIILVDILGPTAWNTGGSSSGGDDDGIDDIVLVDLLGATAWNTGDSGSGGDDDGVEDIILVDILGPTAMSTRASIELNCALNELDFIELSVEVVRSDLADPDSIPGNNDPDEDDQEQVRLYPEVPPCPDCPYDY